MKKLTYERLQSQIGRVFGLMKEVAGGSGWLAQSEVEQMISTAEAKGRAAEADAIRSGYAFLADSFGSTSAVLVEPRGLLDLIPQQGSAEAVHPAWVETLPEAAQTLVRAIRKIDGADPIVADEELIEHAIDFAARVLITALGEDLDEIRNEEQPKIDAFLQQLQPEEHPLDLCLIILVHFLREATPEAKATHSSAYLLSELKGHLSFLEREASPWLEEQPRLALRRLGIYRYTNVLASVGEVVDVITKIPSEVLAIAALQESHIAKALNPDFERSEGSGRSFPRRADSGLAEFYFTDFLFDPLRIRFVQEAPAIGNRPNQGFMVSEMVAGHLCTAMIASSRVDDRGASALEKSKPSFEVTHDSLLATHASNPSEDSFLAIAAQIVLSSRLAFGEMLLQGDDWVHEPNPERVWEVHKPTEEARIVVLKQKGINEIQLEFRRSPEAPNRWICQNPISIQDGGG